MLLVRRLLVALLLTAPLVATGLVPLPAARADDERTPTVVVASLMVGSELGTPVDARAWVLAEHGLPSGEVAVTLDGTLLGDFPLVAHPTAPNISSVTVRLPLMAVGHHHILFEYPGDEALAPSSDTTSVDVYPASTDTSIVETPERSWVGEPVTFTATVAAPTDAALPTGTITFHVDGQAVAARPVDGAGRASFTTAALREGSPTVDVEYSGDANFWGSSGYTHHEVRRVPTSTAVTYQGGSLTYGDPVHLAGRVTATVADRGAPTGGAVTFTVDGRDVGSVAPVPGADLTSLASLDLATLGAGQHTISAAYKDSPGFDRSSARSFDVTVAKRATTTSAAPAILGLNPFAAPNGVLRATVRGGGTGVAGLAVTFTTGRTTLCTATTDATGVATCDARTQKLALTLSGGYVATFAGDANNLGSSARGNLIG